MRPQDLYTADAGGPVPSSRRFHVISARKTWVAAALLGVFIANHLFFNAGSLNYDLRAGTIWAYILYRHGVSALYHLPLTVSVADAWGGVPMQEAAFPYGPTMAYVYLAIGWTYRLFFAPPEPALPDPLQIAFVIRQFNVVFGLLNVLLINKILEAQGHPWRSRAISAGLLLFNPAVWFVASVWGQTQNISVFFVLLGIWAGTRGRLTVAWSSVLLAAMTRQQMIVPGFLLALYLVRSFRLSENARSLAMSIGVVFVMLAPLSLMISPSLPLDVHVHAYLFHLVGENDRWSNPVSWSALSLWTFAAAAVNGLSGLDRFTHSAMELQIGPLTYWRLGNYSSAALVLGASAAILFRPKSYLVALASATLGFFLLKTSFAAFHLIPALALTVLTKEPIGSRACYVGVGVLTTTVLLSMYGMAAVWMMPHPFWGVGIFASGHPVTSWVKGLVQADWFITSGSLLNLAVLLMLGWGTVRRLGVDSTRRASGQSLRRSLAEPSVSRLSADRRKNRMDSGSESLGT